MITDPRFAFQQLPKSPGFTLQGNDEARMTNDELMTKPEFRNSPSLTFVIWSFLRHSSFVIRHFKSC